MKSQTLAVPFLWLLLALPAGALTYTGSSNQFAGGFNPSNAADGGFGGGACTATHTPIVFLHGNGDEAKNWDYPPSTGVASVYATFRAAGYAVKSYTGKSQVDVIAHSMGVTVGIHGIDYGNLWGSVRRFIAISGGLRGLSSCYWAGYANPAVTTCGSQNIFNSDIFGFFPHISPGYNPKMGDGGYRDKPSGKTTQFYSLRAGYHDQIACSTISYYTGCGDTAKFDSYTNVKAQLDVGRGSTAAQFDYNFSDWSIYNTAGGDADGVGHFRAKNNTGVIQVNMITTACTGTGCCSGYGYSCQ
jgi:pimeloyl-ACP methyl ester carboxylesterase